MRHPRFKNKSDIPSTTFWLIMLTAYIIGGIMVCLVAYMTKGWK